MSKEANLSVVIRFRVTPEDKQRIDAAARGVGLLTASYLRQIVLNSVRVDLQETTIESGPSLKTTGVDLIHPKEL
jgi:hypothetical protein